MHEIKNRPAKQVFSWAIDFDGSQGASKPHFYSACALRLCFKALL
ncbi:hypothetical protein FM102_12460 [Corynebacterium glutamicum]|nr:hypothetical protein FM102_12460 [Corynebacterium glutamicum]